MRRIASAILLSMAKISADRLYIALNAARIERAASWRALAQEIGVSASLLSRISNGQKPDADGFATIVSWLGIPAEQFIDDENARTESPDVLVQLAPLLRAQKDLDENDVKYLEQVIAATLERVRAKR
jgi:transcriptional regulator with XRE-family HTH domain